MQSDIMEKERSRFDLVGSLAVHLLMAPLWLVLSVGVGESISVSESASTAWVVAAWLLFGVLPTMWGVLGTMLVVWWRQGRGPMWSYPLRWAVALSLTFLTLIALCFRRVREWLTPPRIGGMQ